jgi:CheY-like chemotaxis protein
VYGVDGDLKSVLAERSETWVRKHNATASGHSVLIIDDSESDIFLLLKAFAHAKVKNPVRIFRNSVDAWRYLKGEEPFSDRSEFPYPGVVFLDLKMPSPDGLTLLHWKSENEIPSKALCVAVSNFDTVRGINQAYAAGASTFLAKPLDAEDVRNVVHGFEHFWLAQDVGAKR